MIDLKQKPFGLTAEQEEHVFHIVSEMTVEEKIGQVLCPQLTTLQEEMLDYYLHVLKVGGFMIRPSKVDGMKERLNQAQSKSKYPLLIAANLESGGNGALVGGTRFANPLGCAATGEKETAYRLGKISCSQGAAAGVNWSFAPIVDIDYNYHNPITNVRTFGSDPDTVISFAGEYIRAAKEEGVVATIKHFPGDGRDERDQHLLVSVNDCSYEEWSKSYRRVYEELIKEGAAAVMVGHIAAPYVVKHRYPELTENEMYMPGTQSKALMTGILREELGFNGVIVTDSTLMVGYMQNMPRHEAVPYSIECGADMILFNRSIEEDVEFLRKGMESGILSERRLNESVARILALKMSMGLFEKRTSDDNRLPEKEIINPLYHEWVKECADKAITLVKDTKQILPLSARGGKRIFLNVIEGNVTNDSAFAKDIKKRLKREGFQVTLHKRKFNFNTRKVTLDTSTPAVKKALEEVMCNTESFVSQYDMAMIVINIPTVSNATVVRVNWNALFGRGNDFPWYSGELPLLVVSTCNPYHLLDVPMAHAYVNTYTNNKETIDALFEKLLGRSEFSGVSPGDPFCGKGDTRI